MSTKLQPEMLESSTETTTYQVRKLVNDGWKAVSGAMAYVDALSTTTAWAVTSNLSRPQITMRSPKSAEADRQIERIKSLLDLYKDQSEKRKKLHESIETSISILHSFVTLPLPMPVASDGEEEGTSLFFETESLYGDLEVTGKKIEYYLRSKSTGMDSEIYDVEEVEEGKIPPRLLGCLYSHHAI